MKYMLCACVILTSYIHHNQAIKTKSSGRTQFINENSKNVNEKFKNHNMDGWVPIMPTLEYLQLKQRRNCVSVGYYSTDCEQTTISTEKPINNSKYKSIVELFNRDYRSPYGNHVAEIIPKLPNHYANPIPNYLYNNRRQYRRFSTYVQPNIAPKIELPRFIDEHPTNMFDSKSFQRAVAKYWRYYHQYPMLEPIPGQTLYPPSVPQFKSNPLNEIPPQFRYSNDIAHSRTKNNIKTIKSTIYPFFEHEAVTKKSSSEFNNQSVKNSTRFDTTSPAFSMVIQPTTIKVSSTTISTKPTMKTSTTIVPPVQYIYSVASKQSKNNISIDYGFEKELPRKVVLESPPKMYSGVDGMNEDVISTKLNRFLEYTTSGYSVYVTIKPIIEKPDKERVTLKESDWPMTNQNQTNAKIIPLLYPREDNLYSEIGYDSDLGYDNSIDEKKSSMKNGTYFSKNSGFKNIEKQNSTKTTLKPIIYTLSSLLLDTDNQSSSHQLSKSGQYNVDHLSSTIINDYAGRTRYFEPVPAAEAMRSAITIKHQPLLPNKSNNQQNTNSRWTQPHELYAINNNDGINDRDQKIKDINLDIVITTDGPTNRNQNYENKNYLGINDGDEWNDGNVEGNSRALSGYGRVKVEPNIKWIIVAKSSKLDERNQKSRSIKLTSSSYRDFIIPMTKKEMPKVNNSNIVLGTQFLVQ